MPGTLQDELLVCLEEGFGPTIGMPKWVHCLSNEYQAQTTAPTVTQYADAIYAVWGSPANVVQWPDRVSYSEITQALEGISAADGTKPYSHDAAVAAANTHYMEIQIAVDTVGLLQQKPFNADPFGANNFVKLTDNHPGHGSGEGTNELNSEGLTPNMTIKWTAVSSSDPAQKIQLTEFTTSQQAQFEELAPLPVQFPGEPNAFVTRALGTLPPGEQNVQYTFFFKLDGHNTSFIFDPFIGDG